MAYCFEKGLRTKNLAISMTVVGGMKRRRGMNPTPPGFTTCLLREIDLHLLVDPILLVVKLGYHYHHHHHPHHHRRHHHYLVVMTATAVLKRRYQRNENLQQRRKMLLRQQPLCCLLLLLLARMNRPKRSCL